MTPQSQSLIEYFKQKKTSPDFDPTFGRHIQNAIPTFEGFCADNAMTWDDFQDLVKNDPDFARAVKICEMQITHELAAGLVTGSFKGQGGIFVAENMTRMRSRGGEKDVAINNNLTAMSDEQLARILGRHDAPSAPIVNDGK